MAAVTPSSQATYGDPLTLLPCVLGGTAPTAGTPAVLKRGGRTYKHRVFYFGDLNNADTWSSGMTNIVGLACARDEALAAEFFDARISGTPALVTFSTSGNSASGWLHVWSLT